jgi:hypothetical protein
VPGVRDADRARDAPRAEPLLVSALPGGVGNRPRKSTDPPGKAFSGRVGWKGRFSPAVARVRQDIHTRPG